MVFLQEIGHFFPGEEGCPPDPKEGSTFETTNISNKNNDGRETCIWCEGKTKKVNTGFSFYDVCVKCGK